MLYSNEKYVGDIKLLYDECSGDANATVRKYVKPFPAMVYSDDGIFSFYK